MIHYGTQRASLVFPDGTLFRGYSFGYPAPISGEVVFTTGMTGYPENLTDPSYKGQILVMTYPLVGNYGVPGDEKKEGISVNFESDRIHISGLVVSDYAGQYAHYTARSSFGAWLERERIPAICGIDTRAVTKMLREKGVTTGKIVMGLMDIPFQNPLERNLAAEVSIPRPIEYAKGKKRVVMVDCGVKNNIIRAFLLRDITVIRVPWDHDFTREKADGVILSNGPGDPALCLATIEHTRKALRGQTPILGICLGSQILGLASGARTFKLKYGHRGQNQPCTEMGTKRCYITSQNHGYAVDSTTLGNDWREWFRNENDGSNEGVLHISKPFFGTQFHPEASPGPDDTECVFDMFVRAL